MGKKKNKFLRVELKDYTIFIHKKSGRVSFGTGVNIKDIRTRLWNKNPRCRYCGEFTFLPEQLEWSQVKNNPPYYMATIDHVYSRFHPQRNEGYNEYIFELVCNCCNNYRAAWEQDKIDKEELWGRSGRKPLHSQ